MKRAATVGQPGGVDAALTAEQAEAVGGRLEWARENRVARRVWSKDYTLWGDGPEEIANRLGWLTVAEQMLEQVGDLERFTDEIRAAGFTDCALLGMGGSSLAPEVMRRTFGTRDSYLGLHVLDSTHPDVVAGLAEQLPLDKTLFLVSSKSGGTLETRSFCSYFREKAGDPAQFVAITDPGTSLAEMAGRDGFRRAFLSAPDIGGRYSALSYFGLVPAALMGVDLRALLDSARTAAQGAMPEVGCAESPALWLGLAVGELALAGRDKLTLVVSEPLRGFGLWVEQLVAESTGKEGRGIVPIAGEPLGAPADYGDDRVFAYIRNETEPDAETDRMLGELAAAGHPVLTLGFGAASDLGRLFFLWEFAVAVAGAVIGVNAFDQPNVQEAKDLTGETIDAYLRAGTFPEVRSASAAEVARLLAGAVAGDYVATMAYLPQSAAVDAQLAKLRLAVRDRLKVATTVGYGPRFLHSTGQLHKGGPPSGVFLQITSDGRDGVEIPGAGYEFGALIHAQSLGDLRAIERRKRPVVTVHISGDPVTGLAELVEAVCEALGAGIA